MPRFEWDPRKAQSNLLKHEVAFEDAELVWSDPLHIVKFNRIESGEERWLALGLASGIVLLVVVHTYPGSDGPDEDGELVRIVSARRATKGERRAYEDGDF